MPLSCSCSPWDGDGVGWMGQSNTLGKIYLFTSEQPWLFQYKYSESMFGFVKISLLFDLVDKGFLEIIL